MKMISKRAQEFAATSTIQNVKSLKSELDKLSPMLRDLPNQLDAVNKLVDSIETQVASLERMRGEIQKQQTTTQQADDKPKNQLTGGVGDDIYEKDLNKKQLDMGEEVELEHTNDREIAREIARDHLSEELNEGKDKKDQEYYTKLKKMHNDSCEDTVPAFWRRNLDYGSRDV